MIIWILFVQVDSDAPADKQGHFEWSCKECCWREYSRSFAWPQVLLWCCFWKGYLAGQHVSWMLEQKHNAMHVDLSCEEDLCSCIFCHYQPIWIYFPPWEPGVEVRIRYSYATSNDQRCSPDCSTISCLWWERCGLCHVWHLWFPHDWINLHHRGRWNWNLVWLWQEHCSEH